MTPTLRLVRRALLVVGGVFLLVAGGTWAYAGMYQRYQAWKFDHAVATALAAPAPELHDGDVVGRLEVPRIGLSVMVLQGVDEPSLIVGAGHVPGTSLPGGDGNIAIAAHRDTYFRKLEGIRPGDDIHVETVRGTYEYVVDSTEIVDPADTRPMASRAQPELTLITCYPFHFVGSAPKRFIVHARPPQGSAEK